MVNLAFLPCVKIVNKNGAHTTLSYSDNLEEDLNFHLSNHSHNLQHESLEACARVLYLQNSISKGEICRRRPQSKENAQERGRSSSRQSREKVEDGDEDLANLVPPWNLRPRRAPLT